MVGHILCQLCGWLSESEGTWHAGGAGDAPSLNVSSTQPSHTWTRKSPSQMSTGIIQFWRARVWQKAEAGLIFCLVLGHFSAPGGQALWTWSGSYRIRSPGSQTCGLVLNCTTLAFQGVPENCMLASHHVLLLDCCNLFFINFHKFLRDPLKNFLLSGLVSENTCMYLYLST